MAITTFDQAQNGLLPHAIYTKSNASSIGTVGCFRDLWYNGGTSGRWPAGTVNASGVAGQVCTSSTTGALVYPAPISGDTYIAGVRSFGTNGSNEVSPVIICDRLWENSGLDRTLTTAQTVNSVTWPARDANGTTNGEGVYIGVEISTAMGTGTPTITMSYTNSAGVPGRTSTNIMAVTASSAASMMYQLGLQAGDTGVRSVQSITFSATWGTAGVLHLVAFRPLTYTAAALINCTYSHGDEDAFVLGMPKLYANSCLMYCALHSSSYTAVGTVLLTQG